MQFTIWKPRKINMIKSQLVYNSLLSLLDSSPQKRMGFFSLIEIPIMNSILTQNIGIMNKTTDIAICEQKQLKFIWRKGKRSTFLQEFYSDQNLLYKIEENLNSYHSFKNYEIYCYLYCAFLLACWKQYHLFVMIFIL